MRGDRRTTEQAKGSKLSVPAITPTEELDLGGTDPIASGTYRDVFIYPGRPEAVVKVLKPGAAVRPNRPIRNFLKTRTKRQLYRFMFREYESYLEAKLALITKPGTMPIAELFWLQETSRGLGMVAERVRGKGDMPAKTLGDLRRQNNVDGRIIGALNNFLHRLNQLDIVANDTNPENLLLDETQEAPRFVLVDGFGDPSPVPLKRFSHKLRQSARDRRGQTIGAFLGCNWDGEARQLRPA